MGEEERKRGRRERNVGRDLGRRGMREWGCLSTSCE